MFYFRPSMMNNRLQYRQQPDINLGSHNKLTTIITMTQVQHRYSRSKHARINNSFSVFPP
ncbi:hypothetical protein C6H68_21230 [Photorhabdus luminescens]|uniref:Uncharacterized protein n=1 Tax=Photorhabdus laumondii subsp. clarkei TaxID=2029685 RepID=A0A329VC23_9GAMM|nr:hypothetical protein C6H68_21230 [Photorhabdus luminescens]RAW86099.1 hypothetical protein CKY01_18280 [Photorhabdus laumondii subsp. clarkei]